MEANNEFNQFAGQFFAGILDEVETKDELIDMALAPFKTTLDRLKLRAYLVEITDPRIPSEDLRKLWWSSPADTVFHDGEELREFLSLVRDRL